MSIESNDPEDKVLAFKVLEANATGLAKNQKEHTGIVRRLVEAGAFRAPLKIGRQFKGVQKVADPKWESKVRQLKDGAVEQGMAVDAATGEEFAAKVVQAVPSDAREPGEKGTERPKPAQKVAGFRKEFQPFLAPTKAYLQRQGRVTFATLGKHLDSLPLQPTWAQMPAITKTKDSSTMKPFLESFPEEFEIQVAGAGNTHHVQLKGAPASGSGGPRFADVVAAGGEEATRLAGKRVGVRRGPVASASTVRRAVPARAVRLAPPKITGVRRGAKKSSK
jgi:hypothetical protein